MIWTVSNNFDRTLSTFTFLNPCKVLAHTLFLKHHTNKSQVETSGKLEYLKKLFTNFCQFFSSGTHRAGDAKKKVICVAKSNAGFFTYNVLHSLPAVP